MTWVNGPQCTREVADKGIVSIPLLIIFIPGWYLYREYLPQLSVFNNLEMYEFEELVNLVLSTFLISGGALWSGFLLVTISYFGYKIYIYYRFCE